MPEISRFYGIVIKMFFDDHYPPHFHAEYGGFEALIEIDALGVIAGRLPPRALGLVMDMVGSTSERTFLVMAKCQGAEITRENRALEINPS